MDFLRKKRKADGAGYSVAEVSKGISVDANSVSFVLKSSLLFKKWVEWVEYKGVDYFRATSSG